jgi:hypothetical protein
VIRGARRIARGQSRAVRASATTRPAIAARSTRAASAVSSPPAKLPSLARALSSTRHGARTEPTRCAPSGTVAYHTSDALRASAIVSASPSNTASPRGSRLSIDVPSRSQANAALPLPPEVSITSWFSPSVK